MIGDADYLSTHEPDYKPEAWKVYTTAEMGQWVHLLLMRAGHRSHREKAMQDIHEAMAYLDMMHRRVADARLTANQLPADEVPA